MMLSAPRNPFRLFSLFGTPIYMSGAYLFLVFFFTRFELMSGRYDLAFLTFFAMTFALLFHEFGHVYAARLNGHRSSVILVGLGALTLPEGDCQGWRSIRLSLAGPAASFILGFAAYYVSPPQTNQTILEYSFGNTYVGDGTLWPYLQLRLVFMGLVWGLFNLLPINPLDGGQALREFLRLYMRNYKADRIAVFIGLIVVAPLIYWCLQTGHLLAAIFLGYFAWMNYDSLGRNQ